MEDIAIEFLMKEYRESNLNKFCELVLGLSRKREQEIRTKFERKKECEIMREHEGKWKIIHPMEEKWKD